MLTYLVCYDIRDDRRRARLARLMEGYGERVQYSVFEVHLRQTQALEALKEQMQQILEPDDSNVRFYRLTADGLVDSMSLAGEHLGRRDLVVIV